MRNTCVIHRCALCLYLTHLVCVYPTNARADDPVAKVAHGLLLNSDWQEIYIDKKFVLKTQEYYIQKLISFATEAQKKQYLGEEKEHQQWDTDEIVSKNAILIDRLIGDLDPENDLLRSKNSALLLQYYRNISNTKPVSAALELMSSNRKQKNIQELLFSVSSLAEISSISSFADRGVTATVNGGLEYIEECQSNGVPIPPDWGSSLWEENGVLDKPFISTSFEAEVFSYKSTDPEGLCIALPRSRGDDIMLLGIICQGQKSGRACFWDNSSPATGVIPKGEFRALTDFYGGADLVGASGGICTECHAGENVFIVHPESPLVIDAAKSDQWMTPLVDSSWPQNPGPTTLLDSVDLTSEDRSCLSCHISSFGGRFPDVSKELEGYCSMVLETALRQTMPPPDGENISAYNKQTTELLRACSQQKSIKMYSQGGCQEHFNYKQLYRGENETFTSCKQKCIDNNCGSFVFGREDDVSGRSRWCVVYDNVCTSNGDPAWDAYRLVD